MQLRLTRAMGTLYLRRGSVVERRQENPWRIESSKESEEPVQCLPLSHWCGPSNATCLSLSVAPFPCEPNS